MSGSRIQPNTNRSSGPGSPVGQSSKQKSSAKDEDSTERVWRALEVRLSKTKLCKYFIEGNCKHGDNCRYAHGDEELSQQPNLQKTKMCADFLKGNCQRDDCSFAHGVSEIKSVSFCYKTTPCMWYAKGKCRNGALCRFVHGDQDSTSADTPKKNSGNKVPPAPLHQQKAQPEQKAQPKLKSQQPPKIGQMQPQHVASTSLSMNQSPFMANGYLNSFGLNGTQKDKDPSSLSPNSLAFVPPQSQVELPYLKPTDSLSTDFASPAISPFLGTLMGLQNRLNDISQMNDRGLNLNINGAAPDSTDSPKVQLDNPRLSEQAINSHEVEMLSQHIQSLTNQVKKLQDFINPAQKTNPSAHTGSTLSGPPSTDDSASNKRSSPPTYCDYSPAAVQYPAAIPGFEGYFGMDPRRLDASVLMNPQGLPSAQDLWWGQQDSDEPRYIPTPAH